MSTLVQNRKNPIWYIDQSRLFQAKRVHHGEYTIDVFGLLTWFSKKELQKFRTDYTTKSKQLEEVFKVVQYRLQTLPYMREISLTMGYSSLAPEYKHTIASHQCLLPLDGKNLSADITTHELVLSTAHLLGYKTISHKDIIRYLEKHSDMTYSHPLYYFLKDHFNIGWPHHEYHHNMESLQKNNDHWYTDHIKSILDTISPKKLFDMDKKSPYLPFFVWKCEISR